MAAMADWARAKRYTASGAFFMLLGTAVTLTLNSAHLISHGWALVVLLLIIIAGTTQYFLSRNAKRY